MTDYAYFDNAATTKVSAEIAEVFTKYCCVDYFNPSANYLPAQSIRAAIDDLRREMAESVKGFGGSLIFTSSGTEADNLALFGSKKRNGSNVVISASEHPAVYNAANALKNMGYELRVCPVDEVGAVIPDAFRTLIDEKTALISVMHVNNLTGGINDIKKLVSIAKAINPKVLFHSDGVQALGKIPLNMIDLGVDLYTISGHKIGAPKGIAALYAAKGVGLSPILYGGGQENGIRSSTENVGGIMSFGAAMRRALHDLPDTYRAYCGYRERLYEKLSEIEGIKFLSDDKCVPNILTFAIKGLRGEALQLALSTEGILVGTGSACSARRADNRLYQALGLDVTYSSGIIRISFGRENTLAQVDRLGDAIVSNARQMIAFMRR